jgi:hypothetical protein
MSSVKSEALLLFCRDLIAHYKNTDDNLYDIKREQKEFIQKYSDDLEKAINVVLQDNKYYLRNKNVSRIKIILNYYNFINKTIENHFKDDARFNPAMLCFSMLATWFKELEHEKNKKEYLYFSIFPYGEIYDNLLINIKDDKFRNLNIMMLEKAENTMIKLNNKGLNERI